MVATLTWLLAPVPGSGLVRQRSDHHHEVRLGLGIIFMRICTYMKLPGVPDGGYGHLGAGPGAGGHLGEGTSMFSSPDGQDEAIDTPTMTVGRLGAKIGLHFIPFLYRYQH